MKPLPSLEQVVQRSKSRFLTKPSRSRPLAAALRQIVRIPQPDKWVFIVGCYNSGTTLLERMLATHPEVSALDEGAFRTDQLLTPEELGWPRMWCQVVEDVRLTAEDCHVDSDVLKKDWSLFFDHRKPVFLEKSIVNSARMHWLQRHFPNAYFIAIVRNGYAVSEGIRRKAAQSKWDKHLEISSTYPIELCAKQWKVNNEIIQADAPFVKNFRMVYYEDFCHDPARTCNELWDFMGVTRSNWSEEKIWQIHDERAMVKNMNQRSIARLSAHDFEKINTIADHLLDQYNYRLNVKELNPGFSTRDQGP